MMNYILKVKLVDTDISRKIAVPQGLGFDGLHGVLQAVLGFENEHMHEFEIMNRKIVPVYDEEDLDYMEDGAIAEYDAKFDLLICNVKKFIYRYDFGDSWEATITVEGQEEGEAVPKLLSYRGKMALEDCGGPDGLKENTDARDKVYPEIINDMLYDMFYM